MSMCNYYNGNSMNNCNCNNPCSGGSTKECDAYRQKADQAYIQVDVAQTEYNRLILESQQLNRQSNQLNEQAQNLIAQANQLQAQASQICAASNSTWQEAQQIKSQIENLIAIATQYSFKAAECYKNASEHSNFRPNCSMNNNGGFGAGCGYKPMPRPNHGCNHPNNNCFCR